MNDHLQILTTEFWNFFFFQRFYKRNHTFWSHVLVFAGKTTLKTDWFPFQLPEKANWLEHKFWFCCHHLKKTFFVAIQCPFSISLSAKSFSLSELIIQDHHHHNSHNPKLHQHLHHYLHHPLTPTFITTFTTTFITTFTTNLNTIFITSLTNPLHRLNSQLLCFSVCFIYWIAVLPELCHIKFPKYFCSVWTCCCHKGTVTSN